MSLRMRTRSVGRPVAESRGGGTGEQVGRGGRGRGPRRGNDDRVDELNGQGNDQGEGANGNVEGVNGCVGGAPDFLTIIAQQLHNLLPAILAQVGNQGNVGNQNGNVVNENIQENIRNVLVNGNRVGCSYKEFLACNPKEYDGKGGALVLTQWIEKMKSVQDMSGCSIDQKVKYTAGLLVVKALTCHEMQKMETELWNHVMVRAGHAAYTVRFHELARLVPHLVTLKSRKIERYVYGLAPQIRGMVAATEPKTMPKAVQISTEYGVSTSIGYDVSNFLSNTAYSFKLTNMAFPLPLDTTYRSSGTKANSKKNLSELEFLEELQKNTYHRWIDEDVVNHIAKVLEMVDLIHVPGVDSHQLRMKMNGNWNKRRIDDSILSSNNTTSDSFFKPYLKTRAKSDTKKEDEQSHTKRIYTNTSSSIDEQPNKRRRKVEKFEAIQYSLGPNEEYIAIRSYEYDIWEINEDRLSIIYQDIFQN
ncbi:hypothetical protein Tco_0381046 [Tanacetum coccineum]